MIAAECTLFQSIMPESWAKERTILQPDKATSSAAVDSSVVPAIERHAAI